MLQQQSPPPLHHIDPLPYFLACEKAYKKYPNSLLIELQNTIN